MLKDRGNKKWTSLMLVEHRKGLEDILQHDEDVDMPVLDEHKIEELERTLKEAIQGDKFVEVIYYKNKRHKKVSGNIKVGRGYIIVGKKKVPFQNIINITIKF
ncbi:MAG: YolD-like family protein [Halanaerobiales bacterium]